MQALPFFLVTSPYQLLRGRTIKRFKHKTCNKLGITGLYNNTTNCSYTYDMYLVCYNSYSSIVLIHDNINQECCEINTELTLKLHCSNRMVS